MVDWHPYLDSVCQRYAQWWRVYTFTDAIGHTQAEPKASEPEIPFMNLGLMAQTVIREQAEDFDSAKDSKDSDEERQPREKIEQFSVLEGLRNYAPEHVLLIGRPGSGKSTSLLRLLIEEAEPAKKENLEAEPVKIPVLLELRYFQTSIEDLIRNFLKQHGLLLEVAEIEQLLFKGRLLLLIDGVNELPSEESRRQLRIFHQTYGQVPMVFTTRELSSGGSLGIEKKLEMQPLSVPQMQQFVNGYLPGQGEALLGKLQERLRSFGQTPLLLWMLCSLFKQTGEVPQNLGLVFRQFTRSYEKQLRSDVPVSEDSRRWWPELLKQLAYTMTEGDSPTEIKIAIERSAAETCLAEFLEEKNCDRPWDRAKEYVQDLLNHHLIQEGARETIEFRHQLIQEYYTAESLLCLLPDLSDWQFVHQYINYLKWTEPISLLLTLIDTSADLTQSSKVIQLAQKVDLILSAKLARSAPEQAQDFLINYVENLNISDWFRFEVLGKINPDRVLSKLAKSLQSESFEVRKQSAHILERLASREAVAVLLNLSSHSASYVQRTVNESLTHIQETAPWLLEEPNYGESGQSDQLDNESEVLKLLQALKDLNSTVRRQAAEELIKIGDLSAVPGLIETLKDPNPLARWHAAKVLGQLGDPSAVPRLIEALQDPNLLVRRQAAEALGQLKDASAVPRLIEALQDSDSDVRSNAAEALIKLGDPSAVTGLIEALQDSDSDVRSNAAEVLGQLGDASAVTGLIEALQDSDSDVRSNAAKALIKLGDPSAVTGLIETLKDPNPLARWHAAKVLGQLGDPSAIPGLIEALQDPNPLVRRHTAEALINLRDPSAVPGLIEALQDPNPLVRWHSAEVLGQLRDASAVPSLIEALQDPNHLVRSNAAEALGQLRDASAVLRLIEALQDSDSDVRSNVAEALGQLGDPSAVPRLIETLKDPNHLVRKHVAKALGQLEDPSAVPILIEALKDPNHLVRRHVAKALGQLGDPSAVPILIEALKDSDSDVRSNAAEALDQVENPSAVPILIEALKDPNHLVRRHVAKVLGQLGDPSAVSRLIETLKDSDSDVRSNAAEALGQLGDPSAVPILIEALQDSDSDVRSNAAEALDQLRDPSTVPILIEALKDSDFFVRRRASEILKEIGNASCLSDVYQLQFQTTDNFIHIIEGVQNRCGFYNHSIFLEQETERSLLSEEMIHVDFVILTAIEAERLALCKALDITNANRVRKDTRTYWQATLPLSNGQYYNLILAQASDMANVDAALLAADALNHWKPQAILMVGIAAAADPKQSLGDLVLGRDIYYYDRGKVTAEGTLPEPMMHRSDATLWNRVTTTDNTGFDILATRPDDTDTFPRVYPGVIASGERVIAHAAARDDIAKGHRKIKAIEMEGYGVSAAAWQRFKPVRCLVIRALCDYADGEKNDVWHEYAAAVAAGFTKHFLLDMPLPPLG